MDDIRNAGQQPYFPPVYGTVECRRCELFGSCPSCDRYQRDRRDFTVTSGRCPRLPDYRGFVGEDQMKLYAETFPLAHAKREDGKLKMELQIPGEKRRKRVYRAKCGEWYFRDTYEGERVKRALTVHGGTFPEFILYTMDAEHTNYCIFRCTIEDFFV